MISFCYCNISFIGIITCITFFSVLAAIYIPIPKPIGTDNSDEYIKISADKVFKNDIYKGKFYFIIPADRMCEATELCGKNLFKVKRIEIYHTKNHATVCLMEAIKGSKDGVKIKILEE